MTREQIEKSARKYATDKHGGENTKQWAIAQIHAGRDGFIDGAQWRINSVWHDNSIRPDEDCDVLVETKRGIEMDRYDIDYNELDNGTDWEADVIRWAYIDDLLPERKEETE